MKEHDVNLKELLNTWFTDFKEASQNFNQGDRSEIIPVLLSTYLKLSKNIFDKESHNTHLKEIYSFIVDFGKSDETITNLCDKNLLSFFSTDDKKAIISHFFSVLKGLIGELSENERSSAFLNDTYLGLCFEKLIEYCVNSKLDELKQSISDYYLFNMLFLIEDHNINPILRLQNLKQCLTLSSYHSNKDNLRNHILLKIIDISSEVHIDMNNKLETFEQKLPKEYSSNLKKQIEIYQKCSVIDCLSDIAHRFFNSSKIILESTNNNDFHFMQLASQLLLDESGLIRGIVSDEDSRVFHDLKQSIMIFIQMNLPFIQAIQEKESYKTELLGLSVFGTNDDRHIKNALKNFIEEDYHGFLSRSIPLIEKKLRLILRSLGEADIMPNKIGGFDFRPMNAFMSSDVIADNFTEPVRLMFKVLYDDRRGFNLRNKIAHGIVEADEINYFQALLVLLTLVYLSTVTIEKIDD